MRDGRKKDELGAVGMEEAGADTAVLVRSTRDSGLQPDHINEPDLDRKRAEGENSVSDSGGGTRTKETGNRKSASECWARPASPERALGAKRPEPRRSRERDAGSRPDR